MNLFNSTNTYIIFRSLLVLIFSLFVSFGNAQFINNYHGQIKKEEVFFNTKAIINKEIKKIEVTFYEKQALKGIHQTRGKIKQYTFDKKGRMTRLLFTEKINERRVTNIEWREYKKNRLASIKKGGDKNIIIKSTFYEENKPSINIFGTAQNKSHNPEYLIQKNYKEESAEYINYKTLDNGDSITEWSNTSRTVYKSLTILTKDNSTKKEIICFPQEKKECSSFEYNYKNNLLFKMTVAISDSEKYYYLFHYDSNQELKRCTKYISKENTEIEVSELLYDERTGNLQAIVTKNKITNFINIKKFKYTYY